MDMDENATLAVVVARVEDLRSDIQSLRDEIRRSHEDKVSRNEWMQRNSYVDHKFDLVVAEQAELKRADAAKRAPWWTVGALIVAGASLVWQFVVAVLK